MRAFSGQRLREERMAAGLSAEQLAQRVHRSLYSIVGYERGTARPSVPVLGALAAELGCPVDALFTPTPDPEPVAATAATRGHDA